MIIVMELCEGTISQVFPINRLGSKTEYSLEEQDITVTNLKSKIKALIDIAKGCNHIHHCGVIHFDIKPANILYKTDKENLVFKIADFGVSAIYYKEN